MRCNTARDDLVESRCVSNCDRQVQFSSIKDERVQQKSGKTRGFSAQMTVFSWRHRGPAFRVHVIWGLRYTELGLAYAPYVIWG